MYKWVLIICILIVTTAAWDSEDDDTRMHPKIRTGRLNEVDGPKEEWDQSYWNQNAQKSIDDHLPDNVMRTKKKAKNVIFFIGDGMGIPTVTAARTLMGQRQGKVGENEKLAFEKFPISGLVNTYCVDGQVADSACSATAYLGGVKANDGTIGVDANVRYEDCEGMRNKTYHVKSIAHMALDAGKAAGIVTTTRVTHASPSGAYAHTSARDWENDAAIHDAVGPDAKCTDIAYQLIKDDPGKRFKVILGGGQQQFLPTEDGGLRLDENNLIEEWKADKRSLNKKFEYVTDKSQLENALKKDTEYLLGLFHKSHLDYHMLVENKGQPTLEEMTEAAIKTLSKHEEGYFLFIEGGRIDHAHHAAKVHLALDETIELSKAVEKALKLTNATETLIVVSADHSHVMTISGYPSRGNDILGLSDGWLDLEGLKTLTLTYANGPGYRKSVIVDETEVKRVDLSKDPAFVARDPDFQYPGLFPHEDETHGGEDVAVYAYGPWQQLFTGTYEQNVIPHLMAYAMCIGEGKTACDGAGLASFNSKLLLIIFMHFVVRHCYNKI